MSLPLAAQYEPPRRHPRVQVDLAAKLEDGARVTLGDLSTGGLFCATDATPALGTRVTLRFRLLGQLECNAVGRVVWCGCQRGRRGFGVAFESTSRQMASFAASLAKMRPNLRPIYLAGVVGPTLTVG